MAFRLDSSGKIDTNNLSDKVMNERETRKKLLSRARWMGRERELLLLFAKYDNLMRLCPHEKERKDLARFGVAEMFTLLDLELPK